MAIITRLRHRAKRLIDYLGSAAHRRFVATVVALGATHVVGHELDADSVALGLEIAIGGLSGAWSPAGGE